MTSKQISVFLENKPGSLAEITKVLENHRINMRALSLADAQDFGILRIIVDNPYDTVTTLKKEGWVCSITPVLAVAVSDTPGAFANIVKLLGDNNVNIEYSYAFIARKKDSAFMIIRVTDTDKAIDVLHENNITLVCQHEVPELFNVGE